MVQEAVGDDENLQKELVIGVAQFGEIAEALHWAHFYNVKREDWPINVTLLDENKWVSLIELTKTCHIRWRNRLVATK